MAQFTLTYFKCFETFPVPSASSRECKIDSTLKIQIEKLQN